MKRISLAFVLLSPVLPLIFGSPIPAHSQFTWPAVCEEDSLPSNDPKYPPCHVVDELVSDRR